MSQVVSLHLHRLSDQSQSRSVVEHAPCVAGICLRVFSSCFWHALCVGGGRPADGHRQGRVWRGPLDGLVPSSGFRAARYQPHLSCRLCPLVGSWRRGQGKSRMSSLPAATRLLGLMGARVISWALSWFMGTPLP